MGTCQSSPILKRLPGAHLSPWTETKASDQERCPLEGVVSLGVSPSRHTLEGAAKIQKILWSTFESPRSSPLRWRPALSPVSPHLRQWASQVHWAMRQCTACSVRWHLLNWKTPPGRTEVLQVLDKPEVLLRWLLLFSVYLKKFHSKASYSCTDLRISDIHLYFADT